MILPTIDIDGIATHYEKLPALILPGHTDYHATSWARYLEECIPGAEYWDVHLKSRPPDRIRDCILAFLAAHAGARVHAG
jgi:hypothetical protein